MILSYPMRLACLAAVSMGLLQIGFELSLWLVAPAILRALRSVPLRHRERMLYALQLFPFVLAAAFTSCFAIPRYVANETNFAPEAVGWGCVLLCAALACWWSMKLSGGVRMAVRTMRFRQACEGDSAGTFAKETPVVVVGGVRPRVALVGLLRPFIFISRSLVEDGGLGKPALEVVLDHERSHAAQGDNWKLLSLRCLPRLNLRLTGGKTWMQLWQNAAEWAADEDAVRGDNSRALLLAETLVALARSNSALDPQIACTNFACEETDLALRVRALDRPGPAAWRAVRLPDRPRAGLHGVEWGDGDCESERDAGRDSRTASSPWLRPVSFTARLITESGSKSQFFAWMCG